MIGRSLYDAEYRDWPLTQPGPREIRFRDGAVLSIDGYCCAQAWFGKPNNEYLGGSITTVAVAGWEPLTGQSGPKEVNEESSLILGRDRGDPVVIPLYCSHNGYYGACLSWQEPPK